MLELRELVLEALAGLRAHHDSTVVHLGGLLERASDLEKGGVRLVEQGVALADVVRLEELEDVVGFPAAVGVLDPDAEVPRVVLVSRHLLQLARATLEERQELRLPAARGARLLRPLDESHPHLERVVAVVIRDGLPEGAASREVGVRGVARQRSSPKPNCRLGGLS